MKYLYFLVLFTAFYFVSCESEAETYLLGGVDFKYYYDFKGEDKAIGVKRFPSEEGVGYQFFYFCENAKGENKKKCGAWINKKGDKVKGANNKISLKGKEVAISKITWKDSGRYTVIFDDAEKESETLGIYVENPLPGE